MSKGWKSEVDAWRKGEKAGQELIDRVPYATFLGMQLEQKGEELTFLLPKKESNIGNPTLPAIHGGVVAGFMEQSALLYLLLQLQEPKQPKTIDFTVDYLRAALFRDTYAYCEMTRLGRRVANVQIHAWQVKREDPVAIARAHFLLPDDTDSLF